MTALRRIAQALVVPVTLLLAVTLQLALVNRAPLPGGAAPDLVLVTVAARSRVTGTTSACAILRSAVTC